MVALFLWAHMSFCPIPHHVFLSLNQCTALHSWPLMTLQLSSFTDWCYLPDPWRHSQLRSTVTTIPAYSQVIHNFKESQENHQCRFWNLRAHLEVDPSAFRKSICLVLCACPVASFILFTPSQVSCCLDCNNYPEVGDHQRETSRADPSPKFGWL